MHTRRSLVSRHRTSWDFAYRSRLSAVSGVLALSSHFGCIDLSPQQTDDRIPTSPVAASTTQKTGPKEIRLIGPEAAVDPGQSVSVSIETSPPGIYPVRVALFSDTPVAFTDSSTLETDEAGTGSFQVTVNAPSTPITLRVYSGDAVAEVSLQVNEQGTTQIRLDPDYHGNRSFTKWEVLVAAGSDCAEARFTGSTLLRSKTFERFDLIQLPDVPANQPLAIRVRAEEFAQGCVVRTLDPGKLDTTLSVPVTDLALRIASLDVPLQLGFTRTAALTEHLDAAVRSMLNAFSRNQLDDISTLLLEMVDVSQRVEAFSTAKTLRNWETIVPQALSTKGGAEARTALRDRLARWLTAGATALSSDNAWVGRLVAGPTANRGTFYLETVAGLDPKVTHMPSQFQVSLTAAEANDEVRAAFQLYLIPSFVLGALGESAAKQDGARGVVDGLEHSLTDSEQRLCDRIGHIIAEDDKNAAAGAYSSLDCDEACLADLCHRALEQRWTAASNALTKTAVVSVTARGKAEIDRQANVLAFRGDWVGATDFLDTGSVTLQGTLKAGKPPVDSPAEE